MNLLRPLDDFLDGIPMYRLLVYGLSLLAALAIGLCLSGVMGLSATGLLVSLIILLPTCYIVNKFVARAWHAATNSDSWLITALILFFIVPPATSGAKALGIFLAAVLAMAGKYWLTRRHKHLFNPAALAVAILGVANLLNATWWVGNSALWPFTALLGLLMVRKIRRGWLFISFAVVSLTVTVLLGLYHQHAAAGVLKQTLTSSPLLFLGSIMLTEPATMPALTWQQILYGGLVGGLFSSQIHFGTQGLTPELALLTGNMFAALISPDFTLRLTLKEKRIIAPRVYEYVFAPDQPARFVAGQYLEWTLPHSGVDSRGNRRTFTVASSPTEDQLHIGVKFYEPSSSFKRTLHNMQPGQVIMAGQVAGSFVLPSSPSQKLLFIAGGIGITPFRSHVKYLVDTNQQRDAVLLYVLSDPQELAFKEVWQAGTAYGLRTVIVLDAPNIPQDWKGPSGRLTPELLTKLVPDLPSRRVYVSGPHAMVEAYKTQLRKLHVPRGQIVSDHFSGY